MGTSLVVKRGVRGEATLGQDFAARFVYNSRLISHSSTAFVRGGNISPTHLFRRTSHGQNQSQKPGC